MPWQPFRMISRSIIIVNATTFILHSGKHTIGNSSAMYDGESKALYPWIRRSIIIVVVAGLSMTQRKKKDKKRNKGFFIISWETDNESSLSLQMVQAADRFVSL